MKKSIQYGTMVYDFLKTKTAQDTINLGDYVQSIAAMNLLGINEDQQEVAFVDREDLKALPINYKEGHKVKFIANGWYTHNQSSFPLNSNIEPLFTSVHIDDRFILTDEVIKSFKRFEPIGCRDLKSVEKLSKFGVVSYFSGCLTLTFEESDNKREGIVFVVDNLVDEMGVVASYSQLKKWKGFNKLLNVLLNEYDLCDIENATFLTQNSSIYLSPKEQFKKARSNLEILSKADLVVTTRIHILMPSMSMGTRSLMLITNINDDRFKGLLKYWNYIDFTNSKEPDDNYSVSINYSENHKIVNNNSFRLFMNNEILKISEWLNK